LPWVCTDCWNHLEHTIELGDIGSLFDQRSALQILLSDLGG
jgi:hypothetical protein